MPGQAERNKKGEREREKGKTKKRDYMEVKRKKAKREVEKREREREPCGRWGGKFGLERVRGTLAGQVWDGFVWARVCKKGPPGDSNRSLLTIDPVQVREGSVTYA